MERIEPIRRRDPSTWVSAAAPGQRVERRHPDEEQDPRRRRPRPQTPDGRPDTDGHVDVEA